MADLFGFVSWLRRLVGLGSQELPPCLSHEMARSGHRKEEIRFRMGQLERKFLCEISPANPGCLFSTQKIHVSDRGIKTAWVTRYPSHPSHPSPDLDLRKQEDVPEEVASALHLHLLRELHLACGLLQRARSQLEVVKMWNEFSWIYHGDIVGI